MKEETKKCACQYFNALDWIAREGLKHNENCPMSKLDKKEKESEE